MELRITNSLWKIITLNFAFFNFGFIVCDTDQSFLVDSYVLNKRAVSIFKVIPTLKTETAYLFQV